jgi:hypothetical protein
MSEKMKINDMLLNQLKIQNKYGDKSDDTNSTGRVVNGSKEYWGKDNKAVQILERYQVPKTEVNKQGIDAFMKNTEGDTASKLETVEIAASNGVEMTEDNLTSIHEAVHTDFELGESIEVLVVSENDTDVPLTKADVEQMDLPSEMKAKIMKDIEEGMPALKAVAKALGETLGQAFLSKFDGKTSGDIEITIKITIEVIEVRFKQEGDNFDLQKLIDQFTALVEAAKEGGGSLLTSAAEVLAALEQVDLSSLGLQGETEGLEEEVASLEDAEKTEKIEIEDLGDEIVQLVTEALGSVDMVAQSLMDTINDTPGLKLYIVESTTIKMQEVAESFKIAQKEMLQTMDKALAEDKPLSSDQVKEVLNSVINKLDDVLMKSDVPLYTSMSMEKNLLKMSSNLQEARQLLAKGDIVGAKTIIKNVHSSLEAAVFRPSERKIQGFAQKQAQVFSQDKDLFQLQNYKQEGVSARNVLELFRSLGLNHEYEVSEKIGQFKNFDKEMKIEGNLKEVLHKLEQDEKQENKTVETIEKSLNNLNGQQLLNKQGSKNNQQTMFFNIPLVNEQEVKNMKLYVNSRDANNRLDWENCSLYFVVDLKSYGPTGIKVDIKDRGVSITVKNDNENLKDVIEPLIENLGNALEEVGLKEKDVRFAPLDDHKKFGRNMLKDQVKEEEAKPKVRAYTESQKGFDFKI